MSNPVSPQTLHEMMVYYRERAREYDQWFYRQGRFDRGAEHNALWFAEAEEIFAALEAGGFVGDVLELAPGTGIWTERLVRTATTVTAVDASPEMIEINRAKVASERVFYVLAGVPVAIGRKPTLSFEHRWLT
jgi:SAM-dependent methyltransferase